MQLYPIRMDFVSRLLYMSNVMLDGATGPCFWGVCGSILVHERGTVCVWFSNCLEILFIE